MKCPLCDGTVVNGRCKECGMPYRKDEILYHLNESRSDHYQHASDKARKIMQAQQRAGAGTAKSAGTKSGGTGYQAGRTAGKGSSRTVSRQTFKEQQKQIRQEAMRKMMDTGNTAKSTVKTMQKGWNAPGTTPNMTGPGQPMKTKKRSWVGILCAALTILAVVAPLINDLGDTIKETVQSEINGSGAVETDTTEIENPDTYFYSWNDDEGYKDYSIAAGFGEAEAGVEFDAGKYGIFTSSSEVTLTVIRKNADNEQYTLKDGDDTMFLTFKEGDTIQVESEESDFDSVYLMEWED